MRKDDEENELKYVLLPVFIEVSSGQERCDQRGRVKRVSLREMEP